MSYPSSAQDPNPCLNSTVRGPLLVAAAEQFGTPVNRINRTKKAATATPAKSREKKTSQNACCCCYSRRSGDRSRTAPASNLLPTRLLELLFFIHYSRFFFCKSGGPTTPSPPRLLHLGLATKPFGLLLNLKATKASQTPRKHNATASCPRSIFRKTSTSP